MPLVCVSTIRTLWTELDWIIDWTLDWTVDSQPFKATQVMISDQCFLSDFSISPIRLFLYAGRAELKMATISASWYISVYGS